MSAAVATGISSSSSAATRRNSSSIPSAAAPASAERVRRMSAAAPPPAPASTGSSSSSTAARMTSLAQAAALASTEAERKRLGGANSGTRPTRSSSNGSTRVNGAAPASANKPKPRANNRPQQQQQQQREVVMTKNRAARAPAAASPAQDGSVHLLIGVLGLKFKCLVQREWPCEAMIATAIAEYHLAYPGCEIPDFNAMYHTERKEFLKAPEAIGSACSDNDEIELGMTEKPVLANPSGDAAAVRSVASSGGSSVDDQREMFDFLIMFHRLPLGFTLKQNNEHIVVANIYPHSTATHYERLETGVRVVKIADTLLENLGLRQVHDLIKNAKIPLEIHFRGYKKPSLRASLLVAAAKSPATTPLSTGRRRSVSSPKPEDDSASPTPPLSSARERARTTSSGASSSKGRTVELVTDADGAPQSLTKQRPASAASRRSSGRSRRSSQESRDERDLVKTLDFGDNQSNDSSRQKQQAENGNADGDSNQNEDDAEALLVDQIKTLQAALLKKHEEAKQIARQIELFHEKLASVRSKSSKPQQQQQRDNADLDTAESANGDADVPAAPRARSSTRPRPASTPSSSLKLRLTPEVLEAMDSKAGVPPKTAAFYQSSNVSSVSGYSNYSSRSNAAAPRSSSRAPSSSSRRGENMRSDVSVSSATSERRNSNPRSPRSQCVKNINNRYSYIPQKYTANASSSAEAPPSSLSSRGAVMSRAKATRDSFITKSESPGVGYYDVKLPSSHVKGGEIGDSDRSLPWP